MQLNYDDWWQRYRPVKNTLDSNAAFDGCAFETHGKELDEVRRVAETEPGHSRIWTLVDGDDEKLVVSAGFQLVNRLAYFITEVPHNFEVIDVLVDF